MLVEGVRVTIKLEPRSDMTGGSKEIEMIKRTDSPDNDNDSQIHQRGKA